MPDNEPSQHSHWPVLLEQRIVAAINRPPRVVSVGGPNGSGTALLARTVAERLHDEFDQVVIVEASTLGSFEMGLRQQLGAEMPLAAESAEPAGYPHMESILDGWKARLAPYESHQVALWGAGAKGVTFLNACGDELVGAAVDVNGRKWGTFGPGTGHPILNPAELQQLEVQAVVVANRMYASEIETRLGAMGLQPDLLCL